MYGGKHMVPDFQNGKDIVPPNHERRRLAWGKFHHSGKYIVPTAGKVMVPTSPGLFCDLKTLPHPSSE
jgi:hypothetical protein